MKYGNNLFAEADCFKVFREIRKGADLAEFELGQGNNLYPPSCIDKPINRFITAAFRSSRIIEYSCFEDELDKKLTAGLVNAYTGKTTFKSENIVYVNGTSQGISLISEFSSLLGHSINLPIPTYYCYEQSAKRFNLEIASRYNSGSLNRYVFSKDQTTVVVSPNAVSGEEELLTEDKSKALGEFVVYDLVFQYPLSQQKDFQSHVYELVDENSALLVTPSKDLSIPAFRTGVLLTKNSALEHFANRDRYERSFSDSILIPQIINLYFIILIAKSEGIEVGLDLVSYIYGRHGKGLPIEKKELSAIIDHLEEMTRYVSHNFSIVKEYTDIFILQDSPPKFGFSIFPKIKCEFDSQEQMVEFCNYVAKEYSLHLNPSVMFGGTFESWNSISKNTLNIRVNLTYNSDLLRQSLNLLSKAIQTWEAK